MAAMLGLWSLSGCLSTSTSCTVTTGKKSNERRNAKGAEVLSEGRNILFRLRILSSPFRSFGFRTNALKDLGMSFRGGPNGGLKNSKKENFDV